MKKLVLSFCTLISAFFSYAQLPTYVPTTDLYAWYSFSGDTVDLSGNAHHAINHGALHDTDRCGKINYAMSFNGSNQYMVLDGTSLFDPTSGFTLTAWVKFTHNAYASVVSKHENYWANGFNLAASFNRAWININNDNHLLGSTGLINDGQWHFITGVYEDSTMYLYVDAVLDTTMAPIPYPNSNTINFLIGKDSHVSYYDGLIDDIGIWERPLTQQEVVQLFYALDGDTIQGTHCTKAVYYGIEYTSTGIYSDTIPTSSACDSLIYLDLTINQVDTSVFVSGNTLNSNASAATYQWFDCGKNSIVQGETNSSYTPTENGQYAVIVTQNSCTDTSLCYSVLDIGIHDDNIENYIRVYPNPSALEFTFQFVEVPDQIEIFNTQAQRLLTLSNIESRECTISLPFTSGVYFAILSYGEKTYVVKLLSY